MVLFSHDFACTLTHTHFASMSCHSWHQFVLHLHVAVLEPCAHILVPAETWVMNATSAEIIAVDELYQKIAKDAKSPIVVFNGELDRIRSGYYPALFFPKLGKLAKTFIPQFESAYYIHNFKGSKGGMCTGCLTYVKRTSGTVHVW